MKYLLIITLIFLSFNGFTQIPGLEQGDTSGNKPDKYAVVVGISDYQDEAIPDLRFADKDAEAFAAFLQSPAGGSLDEDHLQVLTNEQATSGKVAAALYWLIDECREGDKVIIYFSGHGDVERKISRQPGFLLCWDSPSQVYMAGGVIELGMFQNVISTLSVDIKAKVTVIADACRSGKLSGSNIGGAQITGANLAKQYANEIKILSCQPDEYSIEGEQWGGGRGAFSYHLLDGLYGMADHNENMAVNLMELRAYLEQKVSEEVAPQSQIPMTIGNGKEKLTDVFPDILEDLRAGRKGQLQLFTATESRGIEEEVLAALSASGAEADSNIVEMYLAFNASIANKNFLCDSTENCADHYYTVLSKEPQLQRLHSSMRRNYAAALQDDAQQFLNIMLKTGLTDHILRNVKERDLLKKYPSYLERAAELLGEHHYMYNILQARKYYFIGKLKKKRKEKREAYHQALSLQPDMPHAYSSLILTYWPGQSDSAFHYFEKAIEVVPGWIEPHIQLFMFYLHRLKDNDKAEETLLQAMKVDSNSVRLWYTLGKFYHRVGKYNLAEKWFLKTIHGISNDICFPCAHNDLGGLYKDRLMEFEKAEEQFKKAIELDSLFQPAYFGLGNVYFTTQRYEEAEINYKKSIQLDSTYWPHYVMLGSVYSEIRRYDEAEKYLLKGYRQDSTMLVTCINLGGLYLDIKRYEEAEKLFLKVIQIDSTDAAGFSKLGLVYFYTHQYEKAESFFKSAITLDPNFLDPLSNLGLIYLNTGRYDLAEKQFKNLIQHDSTDWIPYANLGHVYTMSQQWEEVAAAAEKAIKYGPPIGSFVGMLGNAYTHMSGRLEEAKAKLQEGLEMSPDSPDIHIYLAQWYLKNKQPEQAWEYFEKGLEKGIGSEGLKFSSLQEEPDFEAMRKEMKWNELMEKHFPDQVIKSNK